MTTNELAAKLEAAAKNLEANHIEASHRLLQEVLAEAPEDVKGLYLLSKVMQRQGKFQDEASILKQLDDRGQADLQMRLDLAVAYQQLNTHSGWARCRDILLDIMTQYSVGIDILRVAAQMCVNVGPQAKAAELWCKVISFPEARADDYYRCSESLVMVENIPKAMECMKKAASLNPYFLKYVDAELANHGKQAHDAHASLKKGRYPTTELIQSDLKKTILDYVAADLKDSEKFINKNSIFFTMGSCFARNIARAFVQLGYNARHMEIAENINSSYANRYFVDWLEGTLQNNLVAERIVELLPNDFSRESLLATIRDCHVFIVTLGVAPAFFDKVTGEFILPKPTALNSRALAEKYVFRTTTVAENVSNINYLLAFVRKINPTVKVVVTVSPVPLLMTFEMKSAVVADSLSKSTLRVAANEIVNNSGFSDIYYWPSFEIFRWLGCHVTSPVYGADDGAAWHVSEAVVDLTVNCFIETFTSAHDQTTS